LELIATPNEQFVFRCLAVCAFNEYILMISIVKIELFFIIFFYKHTQANQPIPSY